MNILLSGGNKNGKSGYAQDIAVKLAEGGRLYYIATMIPYDDEDRARVARHIENRAGMGFETIEAGRNIQDVLRNADSAGTFLIDSTTALLLNEMFNGSYDEPADSEAAQRCISGLLEIAEKTANAVFVSDYIYSDAARYDDFTQNYRSSLAAIDRALAKTCDTVIEVCAGNLIVHKGNLP